LTDRSDDVMKQLQAERVAEFIEADKELLGPELAAIVYPPTIGDCRK
jgi:hypothetical protein